MEAMIVIGGIAAIYGIYWVLGRGTAGAINNTLNRTNHLMGKDLTQHTVTFASDGDPFALLDTIRRRVPVRQRNNTTDVDITIEAETTTSFEIVVGNRWNTDAVCLVTLTTDLGGGRSGAVFTVARWLETDGSVSRPKRLQTIRDAFESACRSYDPDGSLRRIPVDDTPDYLPPTPDDPPQTSTDDVPAEPSPPPEPAATPSPTSVPAREQAAAPEPAVSAPRPGWYADPGGTADLRWWDGSTWSSRTRGASPS